MSDSQNSATCFDVSSFTLILSSVGEMTSNGLAPACQSSPFHAPGSFGAMLVMTTSGFGCVEARAASANSSQVVGGSMPFSSKMSLR